MIEIEKKENSIDNVMMYTFLYVFSSKNMIMNDVILLIQINLFSDK